MSKPQSATRAEKSPPKRHMTESLPAWMVEEVKTAAAMFGGLPHQLTVSGIVKDALDEYLPKLRSRLNRGRPFNGDGPAVVRRGRPVKPPSDRK